MKFGQVIEYNKRNTFLQNHAENEAERLVPDMFLFFKKDLCGIIIIGLQFSFSKFRQPSTWHTMKTNCIRLLIIDPETWPKLIF